MFHILSFDRIMKQNGFLYRTLFYKVFKSFFALCFKMKKGFCCIIYQFESWWYTNKIFYSCCKWIYETGECTYCILNLSFTLFLSDRAHLLVWIWILIRYLCHCMCCFNITCTIVTGYNPSVISWTFCAKTDYPTFCLGMRPKIYKFWLFGSFWHFSSFFCFLALFWAFWLFLAFLTTFFISYYHICNPEVSSFILICHKPIYG